MANFDLGLVNEVTGSKLQEVLSTLKSALANAKPGDPTSISNIQFWMGQFQATFTMGVSMVKSIRDMSVEAARAI